MDMRDPLAGLNDKQRQVVTTTEGPVLVLAGAGSGKTRALTHRLAYLIASKAASPRELLAVTFTNKAAREMRERVGLLVPPEAVQTVTLCTFHSLGARLLREQWRHTKRSPAFTILDTSDSERLIKQLLDQHGINSKAMSPRTVRQQISKAKNTLTTPTDNEVVATIYSAYQRALVRHDSYDFDDLIGESLFLLQREKSVRRYYIDRWRYISIDEYQDTNPLQEALMRQLLAPKPNLCVVGDDYQAIYSWRGAAVEHILRFARQYPNCTTIYLTQNYRSTPAILRAANSIIAENENQKHKKLWTKRASSAPVLLVAVASDREEVRLVRQAILRHRTAGGRAGDCAVLYRTNAQSRLFEEAFVATGIPYTIVGGLRFYERAEIKDVLALISLWVNPRGVLAWQRVVRAGVKGVGAVTAARLWEEAQRRDGNVIALLQDASFLTARQRAALAPLARAYQRANEHRLGPVRDLIEILIKTSGYGANLKSLPNGQERLENIEELLNVAAGYESVEAFLEAVSLLSEDINASEAKSDRVLCLTLHAAKGLEFNNVWLVGCEEGLLPHKNSLNSRAEIEEERRLLYVGMTRAREHLTISYALARTYHGQHLPQMPSRFLEALPETEVERIGGEEGSGEIAYSEHEVGDILSHHVFGRGVVIAAQGSTVTAVFEGYGVKSVSTRNLAIRA